GGKLVLVEGEKTARGGDPVDTARNQLVRRRLELIEHAWPRGARDAVRRRRRHDAGLHRKGPGTRIADVTVEPLEMRFEHQDPDGDAVVVALASGHLGLLAASAPNT